MKNRTTFFVLVAIAVIGIAALLAYAFEQPPPPQCNQTWSCGAPYPLEVTGTPGVGGQPCLANSTYLLCIGGEDPNSSPRNETYIATLSASGNVTGWTLSSHGYPRNIYAQSCVLYSGYIYCVGGIYDNAGDDVASSYYAQVGAGGIGRWFSTTSYPVAVDSESCTAWSSYIYCVGGNNETDGTGGTLALSSTVWYAQLSTLGIGEWNKTTAYPSAAFVPDCFGANGYIYCVGGADDTGNPVTNSYYAPLGSDGVGEWVPTSGYPLPAAGVECVPSGGYVYCVGGEAVAAESPGYTSAVYYAAVTSSGLGPWKEGTDYPNSTATSCAALSGYIYCVGGYDGSTVGANDRVNYARAASFSA